MTTETVEDKGLIQRYQDLSRDDFLAFVDGLTIAGAYGPVVFSRVMAPFQKDFFDDLGPSLHAVKDGEMPPIRRFWLERTKKGGKDSDLAIALIWLLAFSELPLYMQVGAADKDQAAIVKRRMKDLLYHNQWLNDYVTLTRNTAEGTFAGLDILAADVAGSHGETPDVLVLNELSHVTKWEFLENLMDNADGVPRGLAILATNAGFVGTKAEVWKNDAERNWCCHYLRKAAPWISEEGLKSAKRRNTKSRYRRLWKGVWVSGKGDAFDEADIDRCFDKYTKPMEGGSYPGWQFVAGLDLGVSHDHSGLVIIGVHREKRILRLANMRAWEPSQKTGEVDLSDVEEWCIKFWKKYIIDSFWYDPYQAKLMAQRLTRKGILCREMTFTGKNLDNMANYTKQVIESHILKLYDDEDGRLRRDLGKMDIAEKSYGYKLEATSDEFGHADVGTALVITLPRAIELLEGRKGLAKDDELDNVEEPKWTKEDVDELPDELREIYESVGAAQSRYLV